MPAYNTNNLNTSNDHNNQNVSAVIATMFKERRSRLHDERRGGRLSTVINKHQSK